MNMLNESIRTENKLENLKARLLEWVKSNTNAKPKSKYPALGWRTSRPMPPIAAEHFQPVAR